MKDDKENTVYPVRIKNELYEKLRKISYLTHIPMVRIIREGIELTLKRYEKSLQNKGIDV